MSSAMPATASIQDRPPRLIDLRTFSHGYPLSRSRSHPALSDVSIEGVRSGEIVAVMGPNGSGKSTLVKRIARQLPDRDGAGSITVSNHETIGFGTGADITIQYIPQNPRDGWSPSLSVEENLLSRRLMVRGARLVSGRLSLRELLRESLKKHGVGWVERYFGRSPEELSGGEQQILNIMAALFAEPNILLLDEPTSELDEVNRIILWKVLGDLAPTGVTVIVATHDEDMAFRMADRIVWLRDGRKVSEDLMRTPGEARFPGAIRFFARAAEIPDMRGIASDWWAPKPNSLFGGTDYVLGDDSDEGYLAGRPMTRQQRTRREIQGALNHLKVGEGAEILDVPAGWGRHSIELARLGFKVSSVDLNPAFVQEGKKRCLAQSLTVQWYLGDMRALPISEGSVDGVINLWTSFGFFEHDRDNIKVLEEFARVLKPRGRAVIHSDLNPLRVSRGLFDEPPLRTLGNGMKLEVIESFANDDQRVYGKWTVLPNSKSHGYAISVWSEKAWINNAKSTGLEVVAFLGSLDVGARAATVKDQEFVVVLEKTP